MKSLEELKAIKAKMQDKVNLRTSSAQTRIVVGMATCGIAAGARPVLGAFVEGITEAGLGDEVIVTGLTDSIGATVRGAFVVIDDADYMGQTARHLRRIEA